ncbi:MAG: DUF697 domain-containing protein [Proteobacteria bacterium]|nr:DUF697 domain-containing protein [Pseudomonadota bacterium]MBU1715015.1 DUF697 domain-containing protein [Pseudomonadota bacterium]
MDTAEMVVEQETVGNFETMDWDGRKETTDKLIYNHAIGAMGIGLIPLPVVDVAALTALQIRLLCKLAHFYGLEFSNDKAKNIIAALISSIVPVSVALPMASLMKFVPLVGTTMSVLIMPATGGACTYALGRVFVQHFESGGTFLDFDPAAVKAHFAELYKEGKKVATDLKKSKAKAE